MLANKVKYVGSFSSTTSSIYDKSSFFHIIYKCLADRVQEFHGIWQSDYLQQKYTLEKVDCDINTFFCLKIYRFSVDKSKLIWTCHFFLVILQAILERNPKLWALIATKSASEIW